MTQRNSRWQAKRGRPTGTGNPGFTHKAVVEPPPVPEGKVRCPVCRNVATPTPRGRIRAHRDLWGEDCYNRSPVAPVVSAGSASVEPVAPGEGWSRTPEVPLTGNLLSPKGSCYDCGRLVSGERRFCGRCLTSH